MKKNTLKIILAITLSGLALSANAALPYYTFTDLGTLGGTYSGAVAINNSGKVAGYSYIDGDAGYHATLWYGSMATDLGAGTLGGNSFGSAINNAAQVAGISNNTNVTHATLWNSSTANDLGTGTLGGITSNATAINNNGQVAGYSSNSGSNLSSTYHATIWNGTSATDLGTLGGTNSYAYAINSSGQVAGSSQTTGNSNEHAVLWNGTTLTDLGSGVMGGTNSFAYAINNAGQVAGYSSATGFAASHATLWNGTSAIDLGTLGGTNSYSYGINNLGQVVGFSDISIGNSTQHATLWNGTSIIDLNNFLDASTKNSGWVLSQAYGINDNGWIVGNASNSLLGISSHAFLMSVTPVPEADSYAMALMGLGLIGFIARRRKNQQI